jgi:hypothetical protein
MDNITTSLPKQTTVRNETNTGDSDNIPSAFPRKYVFHFREDEVKEAQIRLARENALKSD